MISSTPLFLRPDLDALRREVTDLRDRVWHYGMQTLPPGQDECAAMLREFASMFDRLRGLSELLGRAEVVDPPVAPTRVGVGTTARLLPRSGSCHDLPAELSVGSYIVSDELEEAGFCSYLSPIGLLIDGASPGEVRSGEIDGENVVVEVLEVVSAAPRLVPA